MSIYTIHRQFHLYMIYYPLIHPNISNFVCYSLAIRCTLYSPLFSNGLSLDLANSNRPSGQSVGLDQIPLLVWSKSSPSHFEAKKHWTGWTGQSSGLLLDFCWTSNGFKGRKEGKYDKSLVHQTSTGLLMVLAS